MSSSSADPIISVIGFRKSYGEVEAVRGLDFEVRAGEVFGLLGPNGAGKTTTVEMLEGLRPRSSGDVRVLGLDPGKQTLQLKDRIGVCLQATNLPDKMRVNEALALFAAFYSKTTSGDALLKRLQLWEKRDAAYSTLSGGQKQRLAIALALINEPQLLFLDEPTTGLDPQVRLEIRDLIEELRAENRTILMTTHYIEEAERLCDRVAIIDAGKIIALDSPQNLQAKSAEQSGIEVRFTRPLRERVLPSFADAISTSITDDALTLKVGSSHPARTLVELVKWLDAQNYELEDVQLHRPTLEDFFIEVTGKKLRD
ncbi:MAG: ABC transporter ATP-binding protein [Verrucomicrobiota bacterium]|nr:ABC transporter ATP-binding protein [Verrucomicrobiota bacterium]